MLLRSALLLLTGCHTVFSLDEVDPPGEVSLVTGTFLFTEVAHDGVRDPAPPPEGIINLTVERSDGDSEDVVVDPVTGAFAFEAPAGERYRLVVTGLDTYPIEFTTTSRSLKLGNISFGRRDRVPVTMATQVQFFTNGATGTGRYTRIASTGHRTYQNSSGTDVASVEWLNARGVDEIGAVPGLLDEALGDTLYYLNHEFPIPQYARVAQFVDAKVTMQDGVSLVLGSSTTRLPVKPVTHDRCVRIDAPIAKESARLLPLLGAPLLAQDEGWSITSVPAREVGPGGRIPLVQDSTQMNDANVTVIYGTPFEGETEVAHMAISLRRALLLPGLTNEYSLPLATNVYFPVEPTLGATTCDANLVDLGSLRPPVLATATLGDTLLSADNQQVSVDRSGLLPFAFTFADDSPYDSAIVQVWEVVNSSGATELRPQRNIVTLTQDVVIDPVVFLRNRRYIVSVVSRNMFPAIADGDFVTRKLPAATAVHFTTMFQIVN